MRISGGKKSEKSGSLAGQATSQGPSEPVATGAVLHHPTMEGGSAPRPANPLAPRIIPAVFGVVILWLVVNVLVNPLYSVYKYDRVKVALVAAVIIASSYPLLRALQPATLWLERRPGLRIATIAIVLLTFFGATVRIAIAAFNVQGWDVGLVLSTGQSLASGDLRSIPSGYYSFFPNNLFVTLVVAAFFRLLGASVGEVPAPTVVVLTSASLTLAAGLVYLAVREIATPAAAWFSFFPSSAFLALSPHSALPYTDSLGVALPIFAVYLLLRSQRATSRLRAAALWSLIGAVGYIGYLMKPTIAFTFGAACVCTVGFALSQTSRRSAILSLGLVCVGVGTFVIAALLYPVMLDRSGAIEFSIRNNEESASWTMFLKMGAQKKDGFHNDYYGAFLDSDVLTTRSLPPDERVEHDLGEYAARVREMGPVGYLSFLNSKATWFMGDGSFFMWGEGGSRDTDFNARDPRSQEIQRYFSYDGDRHGILIGFWQAAWLALLIVSGVTALLHPARSRGVTMASMYLALLALVAFLTLFEARSRYLYVYVPLLIVIFCVSVQLNPIGRWVSSLRRIRLTPLGET